MSNRTLSIAVAVLLVLGVLLSAVVVMQNQQLLILADSVERLSDQAERTFDIVQKRAMDDKEVTSPDTSGLVMEPVEKNLIPTDVDQVFLVKRTYPHAFETDTICTDYKIVATAGGPAQDVLLESIVAVMGSEVIGEGGGCVAYDLQIGKAGWPEGDEVMWVQIDGGEAISLVSPRFRINAAGDVTMYRNRLYGGIPIRGGLYWIGALDADTLAVIDLYADRIVATHDITPGRTLVQEGELFQYYGSVELRGDRTVQYETFLPSADPASAVSTDRRLETWTLPTLPN